MTLAVLLGPARIAVPRSSRGQALLPTLGRLVRPVLGYLTLLDLSVLVTAIALDRDRDNRGINNLAAHCLIAPVSGTGQALGAQIAVKVVEQGFDHTGP